MSEAIVERRFSKIGQIMTKKKSTALDDNSLETVMRVSYHKQSLSTNNVKQVLEQLWKNQKERRIFSSDFYLAIFHFFTYIYFLIVLLSIIYIKFDISFISFDKLILIYRYVWYKMITTRFYRCLLNAHIIFFLFVHRDN